MYHASSNNHYSEPRRGRRNSLICNNCRRDKQKCERDLSDAHGNQVCTRCERYKYSNCSTDPSVKPMERKTRVLNPVKCEKCRKDHKPCIFSHGAWPTPCDRCAKSGGPCSAPTKRSRARNSKDSATSDNSDCMSTIAPSEFTDYTDVTDYTDYDFEYTTGYENGEDEGYCWRNDCNPQWPSHYSQYHDFSDPFSPDSGSSDVSSIAGYSEGPASPFAYRR